MPGRAFSIAVLCLVPVALGAQPDHPREKPTEVASDLMPVTLAVADADTSKPVTAFSYRASFKAPGRSSPQSGKWQAVESTTGSVAVPAPKACRLSVEVRSLDVKAGSRNWHEFVIRSTDQARHVVVKLEAGVVAHGTVRDARTNIPVAGATVTPAALSLMRGWDEWRKVTTDRDGRYELHGVDPKLGVWASHPNYQWQDHERDVNRAEQRQFDRFLTPATPTILKGTVLDPDGKPLEEVTVTSGDKKETRTARDGSYALSSAARHLNFHKDGWVDKELSGNEVVHELVLVRLERQVTLAGRVVGPSRRPVSEFDVLTGPGLSPDDFPFVHSVERRVKDPDGRFALSLDQAGMTWVGVRAKSHALWEVWTDLPPGGKTLEVRLAAGVTVSGTVLTPPGGTKWLVARLVPRRDLMDGRGLGSSWER